MTWRGPTEIAVDRHDGRGFLPVISQGEIMGPSPLGFTWLIGIGDTVRVSGAAVVLHGTKGT